MPSNVKMGLYILTFATKQSHIKLKIVISNELKLASQHLQDHCKYIYTDNFHILQKLVIAQLVSATTSLLLVKSSIPIEGAL